MPTVVIIHPELGPDSAHEVPAESLPHHYRAGWRLLTDREEAATAVSEPEPRPVTRAQAAKAARAKASESEE